MEAAIADNQSCEAARPGFYARILRWLGRQRWFAAIGRWAAPLDRRLYRLTGGKLSLTGPTGVAFSTLLLSTTGRRSGEIRTTPVMYLRDGERFVITSENFGQRRPASWPFNLEANPSATVQVGRRVIECEARKASEEETERYWPRFVEKWPAHESYLSRSGVRKMFVLEIR